MAQYPMKMTLDEVQRKYFVQVIDAPSPLAERRAEVLLRRRAVAGAARVRRHAEAEAVAKRRYRPSMTPKLAPAPTAPSPAASVRSIASAASAARRRKVVSIPKAPPPSPSAIPPVTRH